MLCGAPIYNYPSNYLMFSMQAEDKTKEYYTFKTEEELISYIKKDGACGPIFRLDKYQEVEIGGISIVDKKEPEPEKKKECEEELDDKHAWFVDHFIDDMPNPPILEFKNTD